MADFMYFTSGVTWRQRILPDGTLDQPEILKKWTTETGGPNKQAKHVKQKKKVTTTLGDIVEL